MKRPIAALSSACFAGLLAACSTGTPTTSPAPSSTTTATVQATFVPSTNPTPGGASGVPGLMTAPGHAGTYQLMARDPQIRLTLPDGWVVYFDEPGGTYMGLAGGEFLVGRNAQVIDPETQSPAPIPEDLMGWFVHHPDLNAGKPKAIEISGMKAKYVDVNPTESVDVFYDPLGNFHVGPGPGPVARFYAVPLDGPDLFIAVLQAPGGKFEQALTVGVPVVESLEILD